jgi:TonB family protein
MPRPHHGRRIGLAWAIGGALAIHVLVLVLVLVPQGHAPHLPQAIAHVHGVAASRVVQVAAAPPPTPAPAARVKSQAKQEPSNAFTHPQATPAVQPNVPAETLSAPAFEVAFDPDDYLPRGQLSTPPMALDIVEVPPPADALGSDAVHLVLHLYIDESGAVRHVESVGDKAPDAFEDTAKAAFLRARFAPADVQGQIVKSRITVQVDFEAIDTDTQSRPVAKRASPDPSA